MNRAVIDSRRRLSTFVSVLIRNAQLLAELLQLTVAASYAGKAFPFMVGQDQLQCFASGFQHFGGVGPYFHAGIDRIYAGRNQAPRALDFHHADTACADLIDLL